MMKKEYWVAVSVGALILGFLMAYIIWGASAARLPELEKELSSVQAQLSEAKQNATKTETNLGKIANEKLNLEKENAELKDALEKASKGLK
jgi:peptidoglycan hydrolase CwlO-like protein